MESLQSLGAGATSTTTTFQIEREALLKFDKKFDFKVSQQLQIRLKYGSVNCCVFLHSFTNGSKAFVAAYEDLTSGTRTLLFGHVIT
uniref:Uncharacterized protein n=1 Tax=Lactuca sativa TaxID=4236 RepID=A0A9R1VZ27_LACSA|nr:hypothetical protein LSAT_V11C400216610 [Lactuca sativa]